MHAYFGGPLAGEGTLLDAFIELVVGGEEIDGGGDRRIVGCDGVGEGIQSGLDAV